MKTWTRRRIVLWVAISIVPLIHSLIRKAESRFRGNRLFQVYIDCIQSELDLVDIWRVKNPSTKSYTCSQKSPNIFCRLDYWLISNNLQYLVKSVDIIPSATYFQRFPRAICDLRILRIIHFEHCLSKPMLLESKTLATSIIK